MSIIDSPNLNLKTFVDFSGGPERETWSGLPKRIEPADHRLAFESSGSVNGLPLITPERAARERAREAGLLSDKPLVRSAPTKPRAATELSKYRLCVHEASHSCLASLAFGRPIVRVTINPSDNGNAGHTWNYHNGAATGDDLVIVAAGRIAEEELLGDVYEIGCSGDDETRRELALKLSGGDSDAADALLRNTEASARALVKQYEKTIRRFALRLAAKREFILDEAEAAIRQAHAEVTQRVVLDDEWKAKIARAQAEISVRKWKEEQAAKAAPKPSRVVRKFDLSNSTDCEAFAKAFPGITRSGGEFVGSIDGYVSRTK
jgi:hypothetical protein